MATQIANAQTPTEEDHTINGLHHWAKSLIEKLGWMIISKSKGHNDTIMAYEGSLKRLIQGLKNKIAETETEIPIYVKNDLKITLSHIELIYATLHKMPNITVGGKRNKLKKEK